MEEKTTEQSVWDARYQAEAERLRAEAAGWREQAARLNAFSEPLRAVMIRQLDAQEPDREDLDRLRRALAGLPAEFAGTVSPWGRLLRARDEALAASGEARTPEQQALLDLYDELLPACRALRQEAEFRGDLRWSVCGCEDRLRELRREREAARCRRARARARRRTALAAAVLAAALAAAALGGRARRQAGRQN